MKNLTLAALVLLAIVLTGCDLLGEDSAPAPDSDSSQAYKSGAKVPVDDRVYVITGEVTGPVNDITRQVEPAHGESSGYLNNGFGYASGSYTGPIEKGKGFVRLLVTTAKPATDLAPAGDVTIIKTSDTKAKALLNGDIVTFKCRRQYEALAAVRDNEKFSKTKVETWELDYCRLASPVIDVR